MPVLSPLKVTSLPSLSGHQPRHCISAVYAYNNDDKPNQPFGGGGWSYVGIPWVISMLSATSYVQVNTLRSLVFSVGFDIGIPDPINTYLVIIVDTMVYFVSLNAPTAVDNSFATVSGCIPIYANPNSNIIIGLVGFAAGNNVLLNAQFYDFEIPPVFVGPIL